MKARTTAKGGGGETRSALHWFTVCRCTLFLQWACVSVCSVTLFSLLKLSSWHCVQLNFYFWGKDSAQTGQPQPFHTRWIGVVDSSKEERKIDPLHLPTYKVYAVHRSRCRSWLAGTGYTPSWPTVNSFVEWDYICYYFYHCVCVTVTRESRRWFVWSCCGGHWKRKLFHYEWEQSRRWSEWTAFHRVVHLWESYAGQDPSCCISDASYPSKKH